MVRGILKVKYVMITSSKGSPWTLVSDGLNIYKTYTSVHSSACSSEGYLSYLSTFRNRQCERKAGRTE